MNIQLIPTKWEWQHHDNHVWTTIPNACQPEDQNKLFLLPTSTANLVTSKPLKQISFSEKTTPSKNNPVIFEYFINLNGTPDSFVEFANKFGPLKLSDSIDIHGSSHPIKTSCLDFWIAEHWKFKAAYRLWEILQDPTHKDISQIVRHTKGIQQDGKEGLRFAITEDPDWINCTFYKKIFDFPEISNFPALYLLKDETNQPIAIITGLVKVTSQNSHLTLREIGQWVLLWLVNGQLKLYPTIAQLDYTKGRLQQAFSPENLLAVMWYHFFQVITGERTIAKCVICGQWSDLTGTKKGKKTWDRCPECANRDAVTKFRKMDTVKQLISQGKSVHEIEKMINVESKHIERWLAESEIKS